MSTGYSGFSNSIRLRGLDALRGASAVLVVLYHATEQFKQPVPDGLFHYPVRVIQFAVSQSYICVFLFFVISGFCIHLQWARARAAGEEEPRIRFGTFWKRRIRRLYPTYVIALSLLLLYTAWNVGIDITRFFVYDVVMHLLMLHNFDAHTTYSLNGIFWTLALEEQLYLAYFLLLFIRIRWGWPITLAVCLFARVGWMVFSHVVWLKTGYGIPVPEAAASHWFTWALGALAVEAMVGLVKLPRWTRDLRVAGLLLVTASTISAYLPGLHKDSFLHEFGWFLIHPLWGLGFFVGVNRIVLTELGWIRQARVPAFIAIFAPVGLFSYSMYLTHELVIMSAWRWINPAHPPMVSVFLVVLPAIIFFAWVFFWFCERPFMTWSAAASAAPATSVTRSLLKLAKEGFPSRASLNSLRPRLNAFLRRGSRTTEPDADPATAAVGATSRLANTYADSIAVADGQN